KGLVSSKSSRLDAVFCRTPAREEAMHRCGSVIGIAVLVAGCSQQPPPAQQPSEVHSLGDWTDALKASDDSTRYLAAVALGEMGRSANPALPHLIDALKDSNLLVRAQAAWSLVYVDPSGEEVLQALGAATRDPEPAVRLRVVQALGKLGPTSE